MKKDVLVGGQAVIEGVMMKGPKYYSVAVRTPNGKIDTKVTRFKSVSERFKILKTPFLRGIVALIEMLVLGLKTLSYSANKSTDNKDEKLSTTEIVFTIFLSMGLALLIFLVLPLFLTKVLVSKVGVLFNLVDGLIRVVFFVAYVFLIGRMADIRILFQYHGAEHKVVNCFEKRLSLTVKNAKMQTKRHTRCGTSFLVIVLLISVFVFTIFTSQSWWINLLLRVVLIPVIAGVSYEILRLFARYSCNWFIGYLMLPGFWVQGLTTRDPTDKQLEVSIAAMKSVLKKEGIKF